MQYANSARELKDYLQSKLETDLSTLQRGLEDQDKDYAATQLQRGKIAQCRIFLKELNNLKL